MPAGVSSVHSSFPLDNTAKPSTSSVSKVTALFVASDGSIVAVKSLLPEAPASAVDVLGDKVTPSTSTTGGITPPTHQVQM